MANFFDTIPTEETTQNFFDTIPAEGEGILPTEIIYDPEQDKTIEAPVGLSASEIKYADAIQNKKEDDKSYFGTQWNLSLNNLSRALSSTNPETLKVESNIPVSRPEGFSKYPAALTEVLRSTDPEYKGKLNSSGKALKATGYNILGNLTDAVLSMPSTVIDASGELNEALGLQSEEDKLIRQALTTVADMPRKKLVDKIKKEEQTLINAIPADEVNQANLELIQGAGRPIASLGILIAKKDPALAARLMALDAFGGVRREAIDKGFSPLGASATAAPVAAAQFYLDKFSNSVFFDNIIQKVAPWAMPKVLGTEIVTETAQQAAEIGVTNIAGLRKQTPEQMLEELKATIYATTFYTGLLGGGTAIYSTFKEGIKTAAVNNGIPKEEVDKAFKEVLSDPDLAGKAQDVVNDIISPIADKDNWANDVVKLLRAREEGLDIFDINENLDKGIPLEKAISDTRAKAEQQKIISTLEAEAQAISQREADLMQPQITDTDPEVIKARINKLDSDLAALDDRINAQQDIISERFKAGKSTKAVENKLESLLNKREAMATELAGLETADRRNVVQTSDGKGISEGAVVAAESLDKDVTIKGRDIRENARKMAIAKIKNLAKGIRSGKSLAKQEMAAVQKAVTQYINDYIKNSPDLSSADKAKFITPIRATQTFEQFQKNLPLLESMLARMERKAKGSSAKSQIAQELSSIKPKTKDGKTEGKFTAEIQQHLNNLKQYYSFTQEEASNKLAEILDAEFDFSPMQIIENQMLAAITNGDKTDASQWQELLQHIKEVKAQGRSENLAKREAKVAIRKQYKEEYLQEEKPKVTAKKDPNKAKSAWINYVRTYIDRLNYLTQNSKLKNWLSIQEQIREYKKNNIKYSTEAENRIIEELGLKNYKEFQTYYAGLSTEIKVGDGKEYIRADGEAETIIMTRGEIIDFYMKLKQQDGNNSIREGNSFTDEMITDTINELTDQDKKLADTLIEMYSEPEGLQRLAAFYEERTGVPFPYVVNYSPLTRVDFEQPNQLNDFFKPQFMVPGLSPSLAKKRKNAKTAIKFNDPITQLFEHISHREKYIAMSDKLRDLLSFYNDPKIAARIRRNHGNEFIEDLRLEVETFSVVKPANKLARVINKLAGNMAIAKLAGKLAIAPKQYTSVFTSLADVSSASAWAKGYAEFLTKPKQAYETMMSSPVFRDRYGRGLGKGNISHDYELIKSSFLLQKLKKYPGLYNKLMISVTAGDMASSIQGGWIIYNDAIKNLGLSPEQAMRKAENWVNETQQTTDPDQLSLAQKDQNMRALFMFRSAPMAMSNAMFRRVQEFNRSKQDRGAVLKLGRQVLGIWVLPAVFFQAIATAFTSDEEDYLKAAIVGPFNAYLLAGEFLDYMVGKAIGAKAYTPQAPGVYGITQSLQRDLAGDLDTVIESVQGAIDGEDIDGLEVFKAMTNMLALAGQATTGLPPDVLTVNLPVAITYMNDGIEENDDSKFVAASALAFGLPKSVAKEIGGETSVTKEKRKKTRQEQKQKTRVELIENN